MIYLDHAATSFPLVRGVEEAFCRAAGLGNPGRSGHRLSMEAASTVFNTRVLLAELFSTLPERVIFTSGATAALNQAIFGCFSGGAVVTDVFAHNAVLRPLHALSVSRNASVRFFEPFPPSPEETVRRFLAVLSDDTRMAVLTAASNICSATLPIEQIGKICRERDILLIVDGAQYAGHAVCNLEKNGVDILCVPGHKGLQGVMGCGAMILSPSCKIIPEPILFGGSGSFSRHREMPEALPDRLEAGTLPLAAIASLGAGVRFVKELGENEIAYREKKAGLRAAAGLSCIRGVTVYPYAGGTFVFSHRSLACEEIAARLDACGICVRAGLHCAPLAHETLETPEEGAVRVSVGPMTQMRQIDVFLSRASSVLACS